METKGDIALIFYEKNLSRTLLGRAVEDTSLSWLGRTDADIDWLDQQCSNFPRFAIISCEWLGKQANVLISAIRSRTTKTSIVVCCVQHTVPSTPLFNSLVNAADPDVFCHISELSICLNCLVEGHSFVSSHRYTSTNGGLGSLPGWSNLSKQERKIIRHLAEGAKGPEIATKLYISPYTVNNHKAKIAQKLNISGGPGSLTRFIISNIETILRNSTDFY